MGCVVVFDRKTRHKIRKISVAPAIDTPNLVPDGSPQIPSGARRSEGYPTLAWNHRPAFELVIAGRKIDNRTAEARRFRCIGSDLTIHLGRSPTGAERLLLMNAATIAMLCEQTTADLLEGKPVDQENHRRNVAMLGQLLIKLGMAAKSCDVTKGSRNGHDDFGAALIGANTHHYNHLMILNNLIPRLDASTNSLVFVKLDKI